MSILVLYFIILVEGFVTISAEILTIRQLLPVVGNSVLVTSLIIGVFLLFLAYGYRRGGYLHENYIPILKRNFLISAFWLGIGLSYTFINLFFNLFYQYISREVLFALTVYLLIITAPLVYILGQTVPITMNFIHAKTTGAIGGKILHLSTLGSFFGAVLTTLLLMEYLGVAWTVVINFCFLSALSIILSINYKKQSLLFVGLGTSLVMVYTLNVYIERQWFVQTNAYGNYQVLNIKHDKILVINESSSSFLSENKQGFSYVELIKRILFQDLKLKNKNILVLGAGGFTISAESTNNNHFTYVDVDKDIESIARKYFLSDINGKFVVADARTFLGALLKTPPSANIFPKRFDVIISDAYSNQRAIPTHLLTQPYFKQIKEALNLDGFAIFNIVARPMLSDAYSQRIDNTIRSVFKVCVTIPVQHINDVGNIVYVCKNVKEVDRGLYTDDLNSATLDSFHSINK